MPPKPTSPSQDPNTGRSPGARLPLAAPAPLGTLQEELILQRVETRVMDAIHKGESAAQPQRSSSQPMLWGLAAACACLFVLFFTAPWEGKKPPPLPPLALKGSLATQAPQQHTSTPTHFRLAQGKRGTIQVAKRWKLNAFSKAAFSMKRPQQRRLNVQLQHGTILLDVTPNTMQHVHIQSAGVQVLVKGTVFSVQRTSRWVRVEVWRGKVEVRSPSQQPHLLNAQHGVRIALTGTHKRTHYPLPPHNLKTPSQRLQWLAKHDRTQLFLYAQDLLHMDKHSLKTRTHALDEAVALLKQHNAHQHAFQLLLALHKLPLPSDDKAQALFDAARECQKAKQQPRLCASLFSRYLQTYPQGTYSPYARYLKAKLCLDHNPPRVCAPLFQQYLKRHPQGMNAPEARKFLQKHKGTPPAQ